MKTRQMISGFVAVVLIAGAAVTSAAATWRSPAHAAVPNGSLMLKDIKADVSKLAIQDYEDMSLVFSKH
jgi:hypothetical protein